MHGCSLFFSYLCFSRPGFSRGAATRPGLRARCHTTRQSISTCIATAPTGFRWAQAPELAVAARTRQAAPGRWRITTASTSPSTATAMNGWRWGRWGIAAIGVPTNGLVGHWKLDDGAGGTVTDSTGSNNGTLNGGTWTTGVDNGALQFTSGDYVSMGDPASGVLDPVNAISIAYWVNFDQVSTSAQATVCKNSSYCIRHKDNVVRLTLWSPGPITTDAIAVTEEAGEWHHYTVTFDNTSKVWKLYKDGAFINSSTHTQGLQNWTSPLELGRAAWDSSFNFSGGLDDVRIYNRVLSATEIQNLYLASSLNAGLVGWWKLDDGAGTTATDSSGNGNDGTLTNMAGTEWTSGVKSGALNLTGCMIT